MTMVGAVAQAVSSELFTAAIRVHALVNVCRIYGGQGGTGTGFT
jgi:hypothetical protein